MTSEDASDTVKIFADLPLSAVELVRRSAVAKNVSFNEALRQAITVDGALQSQIRDGDSELLLRSGDGRMTRLNLKPGP